MDGGDKFPSRELMDYLGDDMPSSGFLTRGLKQIFKTRTGLDSDSKQRILDSVEGAEDLCKQLTFNSTRRDFLKIFLLPQVFSANLNWVSAEELT